MNRSRSTVSPADGWEPRPSVWVVAAGLLVFALAGALASVLEVLLVPFRFGSTAFPLAVLLAVLGNAVLPWVSARIGADTPAAAAPFVGWLIVVIVFGVVSRPEGDVLLPGGSSSDAVTGYAFMAAGFIVGLVSVLRCGSLAMGREPSRVQRLAEHPPVRRR